MIIMIFLVILFILGYIISGKCESDGIEFSGLMMMLCSGVIIIFCIIMITHVHVGVDCKINEDHMQYEGLCHRLEIINSDYEDVSKSEVIKDVTEWNTRVYHDQYWTNSPLTNWFYSKERTEALQYIPLDTNTY